MVASAIEREVKLETKGPLELERLGGEALERRTFVSTYHDTADGLLARCGITLRRRLERGRNDWQLKLPTDTARREVEAPGPPSGPPASIADLLAAFLHHGALVPLATLRTTRDGVLVRTATGIAEVAVDDVAVLDGARVTRTFGEVEIELIGGDERALRSVERAVKRLGARRSDGRTKIARALGVRDTAALRPKTDADRFRTYVAECYVDLLAADPGVRLGADTEPVHDARVAVRRLRALIRAARPMLPQAWAERTRAELDWLGTTLGPLRDLDVLFTYLEQESSGLTEEDQRSLAPARAALDSDRAAARAAALEALAGERYLALLDVLASPPSLSDSDETLRSVARAELRRLRKTMRDARAEPTDELLHEARIRAKRVRYLAEALGAKRVVSRARAFQDVVGEHQDAVVAEERLRALADRVPESALALGALIARQHLRRTSTRGDVPKAWRRLKRAAANAWS